MKILAVNPGSTSTKIAVYEDETPRLVLNIRHSVEELSQFPRIIDQFEFRKHLVLLMSERIEQNYRPKMNNQNNRNNNRNNKRKY